MSTRNAFIDLGMLPGVEAGVSAMMMSQMEKLDIPPVDEFLEMIEAGGGGSRVTDLENAIKYNAFVRVRPIARRSDLVAVIEVM